ncbi:hypothetical protein IEO21_09612 [Rhodonia placenta]|uniref:Uncharacterized protein n=1 Tax=Rhodonia placenta TaxID=104341 RepID=A0A8H7NU22_9APHY|nr:hypothetical protein IEO21_09612 [Postia placenta]
MGLTDAVWDLVTKCWAHKREDRPHMGFVVSQLCDYYNFSVNTDGSISTRVKHGISSGLIRPEGRYLKEAVPRRALRDYQVERKNTSIRWNMSGPSLADRMRALTLVEESRFPAPVATFYEPSGSRGIALTTCRDRLHSQYDGMEAPFYLKDGISRICIDTKYDPDSHSTYDSAHYSKYPLTLRDLAHHIAVVMKIFIYRDKMHGYPRRSSFESPTTGRWRLGDDPSFIQLSDIYLVAVDYVGHIIRPVFEIKRKDRW